MAEPLKAVYDPPFARNLARLLQAAYPPFDAEGFERRIMDETWEELELKARTRRVAEALGAFLPQAYEEALDVVLAVAPQVKGLPNLAFPDFVERFGQSPEHWDLSVTALEELTAGSSSEFAVRPFLLREPERMMARMLKWADHPDEHVRRLASEGGRPRLPWAMALPAFIKNPGPIVPVLEKLKADSSLYVRKSVANNLNDISKDHPSLVLELAGRWKGVHPDTDWIVRHGSRTLIRNADPAAMGLFGYAQEAQSLTPFAELTVDPAATGIGGETELRYRLVVREGEPVRLRIEYGIYFVKSSGRSTRKSFLFSDKSVPGGAVVSGARTHRWADLTTRKHYAGAHRIVLLVNGREAAGAELMLLPSETAGASRHGQGGQNGGGSA